MQRASWFSRIAVALIFAVIAIGIFSILQKQYSTHQATSTPSVFPPDVDDKFIKRYAMDVDLNTGISVVRSPSLIAVDATPSPYFIDFVVFNHTKEPIVFPNQGFGLRTFVYDESTQAWSEIHLQKPAPTEVILPAGLERYDYHINNSWALDDLDFADFEHDAVRIYIIGVGKETGKSYAAYYDARLQP
jgi:hypothetical protein